MIEEYVRVTNNGYRNINSIKRVQWKKCTKVQEHDLYGSQKLWKMRDKELI